MSIQVVQSVDAPEPIGPYSQGIAYGNLLFPAGQIGLDPVTGQLLGGVEAQTRQCFKNLEAVCRAAGTDIKNTIKITVLITDMLHFAIVNRIMEETLQAPFPARTCFAVKELPKGALVELDAVVAI
ncbi:MAG: Rid family detoxifying hydrolase [Sutterella sp.]|nr:Rid family detoxifying hydrolase [Sutterella sp.]